MKYVGRFAPSPSGPLHSGSLVAAAASFLHARQAGGRWLVRIEDIDPPRTVPGAADEILRTLDALALHWDGSVLYQSAHVDLYRDVAHRLVASGEAFRCSCSRSSLRAAGKASGSRYPGFCRSKREHAGPTAIRMRVDAAPFELHDGLQGTVFASLADTSGDYVIFRRDGLPAYHLAVVEDDAVQGITTIVRGVDLLDSTFAHLHLQRALALPTPRYFHLPVVVNRAGQKLSKRTGAAPVDRAHPSETASQTLAYLGVEPPADLRGAAPAQLWAWAIEAWRIETLNARSEIAARGPPVY